MSPLLELQQDVLNRRHPQRELPIHVVAIHRVLPLDVVEELDVLLQQIQPPLDHAEIPAGERLADAERIRQLQPQSLALVEPPVHVALKGLEPAGHPHRRLAELGAKRLTRTDREDLRRRAEQLAGMLGDEGHHRRQLGVRLEQIDLVEDDDDLLAPLPNRRQELAFALSKRPIGRGDEQHQVRSRQEIRGDRLVLADHRVSAGRVHYMDVAQKLHWGRNRVQMRRALDPRGLGSVLEQVHLRRGRRDPFGQHAAAEQRVDECTLARIELPDDDDEEQLVELLHRSAEGVEALVRGSQADEHVAEL